MASHDLGMVKPNTAPVWLEPRVPTFSSAPPVDLSVRKAKRLSSPLTWMQDLVASIWSSL
jgi:hypothetical protein